MPNSASSIGKKMAKGAAWMVGVRFALRGIGLVSTIILARLLVPDDFGLVALASLLFGILLILGDFGFDNYLIKEQDADRSYYDTVWTMTIIRGLIVAAALALSAPLAVAFFDEPRIAAVLYCLAGFSVLMSLKNVGVVDFRKDMTFGREFTFTIVPKIGAFVVTVGLAVLWRDYWALIAGMAAHYVVALVASFVMHPYRPRLSLARWRRIIGFSIWLLLNNIMGYINVRSDEFVIGRLMGTASVGMYAIAHEVASTPTSELVAPIRRAIFPGYAKLAVRPEALRDGFIDVWALVLLAVTPMAVGISLTAEYLVPLALGWKWIEAIPLIQVLAFFGLFAVLNSNTSPVYLALGHPRILTGLMALYMVIKLPLLIWAVSAHGPIGAAWAATATTGIVACVDLAVVSRFLKLSLPHMARATWRIVVATALMTGAVVQIDLALPAGAETGDMAVKLAAMALGGAAVYVFVALALWRLSGRPPRSPESAALKLIMPIVGRALPAAARVRPPQSRDQA